MAYDIGDSVRFRATMTTLAEDAADPTGVVVQIQDPSGNTASYTYDVDAAVKRESEGIFYIDITINESGIWRQHWAGTGALVVAEEASISVRTSHFSGG